MHIRPRRNRKNAAVRFHSQETHLHVGQLIYPLFLFDGKNIKEEVASLPGNFRWSLDRLIPEIEACMQLGITTFVLFPAVEESLKDKIASYSYAQDNFYLHAIYTLKEKFPECCIMTDVAMDPYSSDGHDGFVLDGQIMNDETLPILAKMAVAQAQAGADILGPSDMMDGRIGYIREALDGAGFTNVSIMSYSAKYASAFYGPFRDALDSAPKAGDKKTYQMNPANKREALIEAQLDVYEGADYLMVKPALPYLDIIHLLKENCDVPISAYNVSGECAMLIAACQNGWLDFEKAMPEMLLSIKRAGADVILTYFAKAYAKMNIEGKF
ncbi:porphobilinogen synthase [Aureispira]|nr:porphobilinogen synthase [Aureispira sp.]